MFDFLFVILSQTLTFLPLALGITISYSLMRATDMTIDGSFVVGAAVFARLLTLGFPPMLAGLGALVGGAMAGMLTAFIQRGGKIDPLLAGVLATFILSSLNLVIMGKPNINLLSMQTLVSSAFNDSELAGFALVGCYTIVLCLFAIILMKSTLGLKLRAFGDNPKLLKRLGNRVESYRLLGFAASNLLAAASGCLTAQTVGYADIGMGFGVTLTGIGAVILGQQILQKLTHRLFRTGLEFLSALVGVILYYFALNLLLRLDIDPIYLKMMLGLILIFFLRTAIKQPARGIA